MLLDHLTLGILHLLVVNTWQINQFVGTSGVFNKNGIPLPTNTKLFILYTTNFTSSTNTNYNPELTLPTDTTVGSEYYIKNLTSVLNSCPSDLENLNSTFVLCWYSGCTQTVIRLNTANDDAHFISVYIVYIPVTSIYYKVI